MKEDITQHDRTSPCIKSCCGLVMKEDITQHFWYKGVNDYSCGLVMKEDITQHRFSKCQPACRLWFGDERRYYTTLGDTQNCQTSCGLVMKEDITQLY